MTALARASMARNSRLSRSARIASPFSGEPGRLSFEEAARLGNAGFLTLTAPRTHGGEGVGYQAALRAVLELARSDTTAARFVAAANFGAIGAIRRHATDEMIHRAVAFARAGSPAQSVCAPEQKGSASTQWTSTSEWASTSERSCFAERLGAEWRLWGEAKVDAFCERANLLLLSASISTTRYARTRPKLRLLLDRDCDKGVIWRPGAPQAALIFDSVQAPLSRALANEEADLQTATSLETLMTSERRLAEAALAIGSAETPAPGALAALDLAAKSADRLGVPDPRLCAASMEAACGARLSASEKSAPQQHRLRSTVVNFPEKITATCA